MRAVVFALLLALTATAAAEPKAKTPAKTPAKDAKKTPEPPPLPTRTPGAHDANVIAVLEKIAAGTDSAARAKAIAELGKLAPDAIDAIGEWLQRPHQYDVPARQKILLGIKAAVPDKTGRFNIPQRQSSKEQKADDELDWLKSLLDKAQDPAEGEVIADVAAIRALADTKSITAAQWIFDAAFLPGSMPYRDECGRYLRKMEPHSIPSLTRESLSKDQDRKRYATWQLERLDRQDAAKAMSAATGDEALQVAILDVFREVHHREAVHSVWTFVNDGSHLVRAAARRAWMDYITGPPPPPAPRQHLKLPGGKQTRYAKPLWLTYRELADNELRKAANELLHEDYALDEMSMDDSAKPVKATPIDLEDVTKRLFAYYDGERKKHDSAQWDEAKKKSAKGDVAAAAKVLDQLVARSADHGPDNQRVEMAKIYVAYGKQLESTSKWAEASGVYSKAYGLDPKPNSLAAHHYTLGKSLEVAGEDGGPDYRRAVALDPEYAPAKTAAAESGSSARPVWMLYAAIGAGGVAMLLFFAAMLRRRNA